VLVVQVQLVLPLQPVELEVFTLDFLPQVAVVVVVLVRGLQVLLALAAEAAGLQRQPHLVAVLHPSSGTQWEVALGLVPTPPRLTPLALLYSQELLVEVVVPHLLAVLQHPPLVQRAVREVKLAVAVVRLLQTLPLQVLLLVGLEVQADLLAVQP
jgi:hypothetical protein